MMRKILVLLVFLLLTACGPAPQATALPASITPPPEPTPAATATVEASRTPTPRPAATQTPAPTATPTLTPAPLGQYAALTVTRVEYRSVGGVALTLKLPGITRALDLTLGGIKFTCAFDPAYPDVLFCTGLSSPPLDTRLPVTFIDPSTGRVDYEGALTLRQSMFPTATPISPAGNWCPQRGQKVEVEWECRIHDNNPCVVASVYDACGYWYSVHSCPDEMELPSPNCSAEQFAAMRKLYGFP